MLLLINFHSDQISLNSLFGLESSSACYAVLSFIDSSSPEEKSGRDDHFL